MPEHLEDNAGGMTLGDGHSYYLYDYEGNDLVSPMKKI
tara:strand:+ start:344 stop:457 length:114 start_codon:yes stop_codon:yes gene_type:complete